MCKFIAAAALYFVFLFPRASSAQPVAPDDKSLLAARRLVWTAYFENNQAKLRELLPKNLVTGDSDQEVWKGREETLGDAAAFAAHHGKLLRLDFSHVKIQHFHEVAVIYSDYSLAGEWSGKAFSKVGKATEVFVFRNGAWRNTGWQLGDYRASVQQ